MELVNSRYRIIKNIRQNTFVSSYVTFDILNKNSKIQLNIINPEYLPEQILNFFTSEFISLANLKCSNILKVFNFGHVNFIDNKKVTNLQYYYTNEYIDDGDKLSKLQKSFGLQELLNLFVEICIAVNYLHLKGFIYGELNSDNIIVKNNFKRNIKLVDIATIELEKYNYQVSGNEYIHFKAPEVIKGDKPSIKSDIYSLGIVLMTLSKNSYISELSSIIAKMTSIEPENRYKNIYEIIKDINMNFQANYKSFIKDEVEQLNFQTKLIGRNYEIDKVVNEYNNLMKYELEKKLVLVHGELGIGKTRFLDELKHIFVMKNITVVSSFTLNSKSLKIGNDFIEFLKRIISECDAEIIEKYQSALSYFVPELGANNSVATLGFINDEKGRFRLLNGLAGFISDFLINRQAIFIVDNMHLADDFSLDLLEYLYIKKLNGKGVMCIISYCDGAFTFNKKFADFIKKINSESNVTDVSLHGLSNSNTALMLQNILNMPHGPIEFSNRIYSKTYGNPQFVQETIKTLYLNKAIYINKEEGHWMSKYNNFDEIPIPSNIEQAVLNQLTDLDENYINVLNIISVFNSAVSVNVLNEFSDESFGYMQAIVNDLFQRGILCKKIEDRGFVFDFSNTVLKNLVYERLNDENRKKYHEIAINVLENQDEFSEYRTDELIYHLEKCGDKEKVIKYCIKNAENMELLKNRNEAIKNLEKAISMYDRNSITKDKLFLLVKLGDTYKDSGSISSAINYYKKAEYVSAGLNEYEIEVDIINKIANCYLNKNDILKAEEYINKAEIKLENTAYKKGYLIYSKNLLEVLLLNNKYEHALKLCGECIEICGDEFIDIKGHFYSRIGDVYAYTSKCEEAKLNYEESLKCFAKVNCENEKVLTLNNIGVLYCDTYQNMSVALEYFNRMKEIAERNNYIMPETLALTNLASTYYYCMEYNIARSNFEEALRKARDIEYESIVLYCYSNICSINLKLHEYKNAYKNYKYAQNEFERYPIQKKDISGCFYAACAELCFEFGDMEKSNEYVEKALIIFGDDDVKTKWESIILKVYISIINKSFNSEYNLQFIRKIAAKLSFRNSKLNTIYNLIILMYENGYIQEASILFKEVDSHNSDSNKVEAKRLYCSFIFKDSDSPIDILCKALNLAKKENEKKLFCKISCAIADYYMEKKNYFYAVNYYFEACDTIKNMVLQIPKEFKLKFIKTHNMFVPFNKLCNINDEGFEDKIACEYRIDIYDITIEMLDKYFNFKNYSNILNNKNYIRSAKKLYDFKLPRGINGFHDVISNIPSDPVEGLEIILRYLSSVTLSTNGIIVMDNGNKEFSVVVSLHGKSEISHSKYLLERTRAIKEPVLATEYGTEENISESGLIPHGIKAVICMPIIMDYRYESDFIKNERRKNFTHNSQLKGILYLESDKVLNNFNSSAFEKCSNLSRLMGSLIEKYQLILSSSIDKLTGVYTRKYLMDFITDTIDNLCTRHENVSLIMFDFDHFKKINDKYGHQTGDEVLRKVCKIVTSSIRKEDICGRYGGEEFIVVLPGVGIKQAYMIAEKLRTRVEDEKVLGNKTAVTISLGISNYPEHGYWKEELIEKADQALYVSKQTGRNKSQIWNSEFSGKVKVTNKLTGIITGNSVQDYRNVLAIADISELIKSCINKNNKIYSILGRIIEVTEAEQGILFVVKDKNIIESHARKLFFDNWVNIKKYNKNIIDTVIDNQQGVFMIDWDNIVGYDSITGIPDWQSIIVVPLVVDGMVKGVLYLTVSTKVKEFSLTDFNFINLLGQIAAAII